MIFNIFIDILVDLIVTAIGSLNIVTIPSDVILSLAKFTRFGAYVVGSDILLIFSASVLAWMGIRFTIGLIVFVWKLLPLT